MASSVLTPGVDEAVSSDIVVTTSGKIVSLYTDTGDEIPYGVSFCLQRLTVAGHFEDVSTTRLGHIRLSKDNKSILINGIGTYRISRPDITSHGVNIGVQVD